MAGALHHPLDEFCGAYSCWTNEIFMSLVFTTTTS